MTPPAAGISIDTGTVLVLISLIALPIAAIAFAGAGGAWRQIGKGRFAIDEEPRATTDPGGGGERALQAAEARQMIEAKSYRRIRHGEPALDVEAELRRVLDGKDDAAATAIGGDAGDVRTGTHVDGDLQTGTRVDPELRDEVRRLVIIRSERRVREGQEPLDIDAETERQLEDFIGSPY